VLAATEDDARLALDVLKWHDTAEHRAALADLTRARARAAKAAATAAVGEGGGTLGLPAGLLEPRVDLDAIMARLVRLGAAEG